MQPRTIPSGSLLGSEVRREPIQRAVMGKVAFGTQSSFFVQVNTDRGMQSCWSIRLKLPSFTSSSIPSHHPLGSNIALYYQCIKPLFVFFLVHTHYIHTRMCASSQNAKPHMILVHTFKLLREARNCKFFDSGGFGLFVLDRPIHLWKTRRRST